MSKDKNAEQRYSLTQKIMNLETKEDDFNFLKRQYECSLENFYEDFQQLAFRQEELLRENGENANHHFWRDWDDNQVIKNEVEQYIEGSFAELDDVHRRFRWISDDERDKLIEERNKLPWD